MGCRIAVSLDQTKLKAAKETAKQRMLLMEVQINRPIRDEIQGAKGVKNRGFSDTFKLGVANFIHIYEPTHYPPYLVKS